MLDEQAFKLEELDRLLNDPEVCLQPALIWALAAEIADADPETIAARGG